MQQDVVRPDHDGCHHRRTSQIRLNKNPGQKQMVIVVSRTSDSNKEQVELQGDASTSSQHVASFRNAHKTLPIDPGLVTSSREI